MCASANPGKIVLPSMFPAGDRFCRANAKASASEPTNARRSAHGGAHCSARAVVISGWIGLDSATFRPIRLYPDTATVQSATRFALVTTSRGNRFHPDILRGVASDPLILAATAGAIGALV